MPRDHAERMAVLAAIQDDCRTDAAALEGAPFNGRTVATNLAQILAMVSTIAEVVAEAERERGA